MTIKNPSSIIIGHRNIPLSLEEEDRIPVIWLNNFDDESARDFFEQLTGFLSDDDIAAIALYIDSFGGQVDSLATIAELIEASTKPIITIGIGKAFSAGALLLSLGTPGYRWMTPHSRMMIHRIQVNGTVDISADSIAHIAREILRTNEVWLKKMVARSTLKWTEFNKKIDDNGGEWYLDAKQAVKYGFVDHIGVPLVRETLTWELVL